MSDDAIVLEMELAEANQRIAKLECHNQLLRAVANLFDAMIQNEGPPFLIKPGRLRAVEALNEAIDGGALDEDGDK